MRLTKIQGADGSEIYIQCDEEENDDLQACGLIEDVAERTKKFNEAMVSTIRNYSSMLFNAVKEGMADIPTPESLELEFGLQLGGEAGVPFITKGTAKSNVKVAVKWNLNKP